MPWANSGSAGNGKPTEKKESHIDKRIYSKDIHVKENTSQIFKSTFIKVKS